MKYFPSPCIWALVLSSSFFSSFSNCQANEPAGPNIVVFLVDDMGVMDTSLPFLTDESGTPERHSLNHYYRTPNMERLAKRGMRFSNFYAMSVCSPTRTSIMTGQNAARHGTTNWINPSSNNRGPYGPEDWNWTGLGDHDVTLARLLSDAGYRTIHIGKGHFGPRDYPGADPLNLGFVRNVAGHSGGHPSSYFGLKNFGNGPNATVNAVPDLEAYHGQDIFLTEALTREAKREVSEAVAADEPFFLYMAHYAVHSPFQSDDRFAEHYKRSGEKKSAQAFATMIEGMDKSLGDLLDHVESIGVADNTLFVFLGDNGSDAPLGGAHEIACAAPLRGKKGSHYEGGMRVPFIAAWAQADPENPSQQKLPIPAGAIRGEVASVCDLMPTLLEMAGLAHPQDHVMDGYSLTRLLSDQADPEHPNTFLMHYPHSVHRSNYFTTYRQGNWKVVYHYYPEDTPEKVRYELFDLSADPSESNNLADAQPEKLTEMMGQLIAELERQGARYPTTRDRSGVVIPEMPGSS